MFFHSHDLSNFDHGQGHQNIYIKLLSRRGQPYKVPLEYIKYNKNSAPWLCARWWHWYWQCVEASSSNTSLSACVPSKSIRWSPTPQCDSIWRWAWSRWRSHEVEPLWMGLVPVEDAKRPKFSPLPYEDTVRLCQSMNQRSGPHQTPSLMITLI